MQRLEKIISEARLRPVRPTDEEIVNTIREYLQVRVLQLIFQSKFGDSLSFMGGTCLRICYDLKRYSEDLDFTLDGNRRKYRFIELMDHLQARFGPLGFDVETNVHEEKTVQKAFLKFAGLFQRFQLRSAKEQKIHIKLEVDTHPIPIRSVDRESFFVTRFGEVFPILKHALPTLFSGKVLALLSRPYTRGRDYYDLVWYLGRKTPLNLRYIRAGYPMRKFRDEKEIYALLREKVSLLKPSLILKDVGRFLEDPTEASWILRYQDLFGQLCPK